MNKTAAQLAEAVKLHYAAMQAALADYRNSGDLKHLELSNWHKSELAQARTACRKAAAGRATA